LQLLLQKSQCTPLAHAPEGSKNSGEFDSKPGGPSNAGENDTDVHNPRAEFVGCAVPRVIAQIAIVAALGVGACAQFPDDAVSQQAATKVAHAAASPIVDGLSTVPPAGFVGFCIRTPDACTNHSATTGAKVTIDDKTAATLVAVNDRVNDAIAYEPDPEHYGVANRWVLNPDYGDCKDYALAKREALRAAGFPDAALRIAIVRTPQDKLHAVLTVETDRGALVLDSLTPEIRPWSATSYEWIERQAGDSPLHWVSLKTDGHTATAAANLHGDAS
jgi:predicted transglutaminase-like cysteine proteinase